jgi:VWFA-related protein
MALALALALAWGVGVLSRAESDAASQTTLDVLVSDGRGRSVEGLSAGDFSVTEQGVPLRIERVRFVRSNEPTRPQASGPVAAVNSDESLQVGANARLFGILLDEYHVAAGASAERVRERLIRFVKEDLRAGDWVAIVKPLDSLTAIQVTDDRDAIVKTIEGFDPRRGDYMPRTSFEREFIAGVPSNIEAARAQIVSSALNALTTRLGRFLPSRKTLIFVSEGFAPRGVRRGDESLPVLSTAVLNANRGHVAIYALNPSLELERAPGDGTLEVVAGDALRVLASETNGRAAMAADDVGEVLQSAVAEATGYYVLSVSTLSTPKDGRWHAVDVSVGRGELVVRARKGYWARSDAERRAPRDGGASFLASVSSQVPRRSSALIRPWFGVAPGDAGNVRVSFVWEPAPRIPGDRSAGPVPARIALSVTALDGSPVFEGVVLPAHVSAHPGDVARSRVSFDIPAGRLLVQMAIEDAASRIVDRDVRDLVVRGFQGPVLLGTPELLSARNVREQRAIAADPDAAPVVTRQFSRADRLWVRIPVFSAGQAPTISARLVSGQGRVMGDLVVVPVPSRANAYQFDVPLASLAAGAYSIEITAKTDAGDARDTLPIRVTP